MKKRVKKNLTILIVILVLIVAGVLIYNYSKKGVLLSPTDNVVLNLKLDENIGSLATDSSGFGNNGVVSALWTAGKYRSALQFTEAGGHFVTVHDSASLKSNSFTISAWVNLNSYPTDWRRIVGKSNFNFASNDGWDIAVINEGSVTKLNARLGGGDYLQIMYPKLPVNEWHLVTLTYDGSQAKLYIDDGVGTYRNFDCVGCNQKYAVKSIVKTIPQNTNDLMIGRASYSPDKKAVNAKIDEVRYYSRALTSTEIKDIYLGNLCIDTDNGVDYDTFGTCTDYPNSVKTEHPDTCDSAPEIVEKKQWETYCNLDGKTCGSTYHFCPTRTTCKSGICESSISSNMVLSNNLVLSLKLNENTRTAADSSGNGNNGLIVNAIYNSSGKFDGAFQFNGTGTDYIQINNKKLLNISSGTVSLWFKPYSTNANRFLFYIGAYGDGFGGENELYLMQQLKNIALQHYQAGSYNINIISQNNSINLNQWQHAAFTLNNGVAVLYLNGKLINTANFAPIDSSAWLNQIRIGRHNHMTFNPARAFYGEIDDVRIYNRTLTGDEIKNIYSGLM